MPLAIQPPDSDFIGLDLSVGEPRVHTTHTHYFGFQIPEAGIGCYSYIRYMPYFPLMQGNVMIFQGHDNECLLDMAHLDYAMALPWPEVNGSTVTTSAGYTLEILEPGHKFRVTYKSLDGRASFELLQTAISPLVARHAVMPGENVADKVEPGGSEQFMHCVGEVTLPSGTYPIDCNTVRDRSWYQDRTEDRRGRHDVPICWTPVYFDDDLWFNQVGFEKEDSDPNWKGLLQGPPDDYPGYNFAFVGRGDVAREVVRVDRNVTKLHPTLFLPLEQEIEVEDEEGDVYRMKGTALAASPIVAWPHAFAFDSVYRWETDDGRVAHSSVQGIWYEAYQHAMRGKG